MTYRTGTEDRRFFRSCLQVEGCLSFCLFVCLSVCFFLPARLPACLPDCQSVCASVCLSACLFISPNFVCLICCAVFPLFPGGIARRPSNALVFLKDRGVSPSQATSQAFLRVRRLSKNKTLPMYLLLLRARGACKKHVLFRGTAGWLKNSM